MNEQPLWQSLLRFYLRVLAVGVAAAALVSLVWSGVLLVRGLPVTVVSVANALSGLICLGTAVVLPYLF